MVFAVVMCPSVPVCPSQACIVSKRLDESSGFWHGCFLPPISHCLKPYGYLQKLGYRISQLWNFFANSGLGKLRHGLLYCSGVVVASSPRAGVACRRAACVATMPAPARRPRADVDRAAAHLPASDGLFTVQRHLAAAAGASRLTTAARWTRELHTGGPVMLSTGIQQPALAVVRPTVSSHDVQLPMHHDHDDVDDSDDDDDESTSSCEQQQQQTTAL